MSSSNYDRLARALESGERGGVFFLYGEESYLREEATRGVIAAHLDEATRDFNLDQLQGDVDPETLGSMLETPPMMAEWRVVVVREAQGLAGNARMRAMVESVLDRDIRGLVLVLSGDIGGSRAKFWKRLQKEAKAVELPRLEDPDLVGWLLERASTDGIELEVEAARALVAAVGPVLGVLVRELDKLREYAGERRRITLDDVEKVVVGVRRENRWEWLDTVAEGRFREARSALGTLLETGESGVGLTLALGTHFLRLALHKTGGEAALQAALPSNQKWLVRRLSGQARRWDAHALKDALDDLLRADRLLKSAPLTDAQVMEELLLRMEASAAARAAA